MNEINYIGERVWAGQVGNAFIVISFVAALLAFFSFYAAENNKDYLKLARTAFSIHSISVLGIAATLFFMLFNHYFEYQYVYQHSSRSMDMKYILSCFWEGQEGSFLLWTFWNVILAFILQRRLKDGEWESSVMCVFALVQVFLASMLLGTYILDHKLGSNPFLLLREHEQFSKLPMLSIPNYAEKLNGRGLNPLLMNYWMTIHPPTLFLGFSSTLIPFAFAIAGLWKKKYTQWQETALPWTYFGILILGVGILMGGAWAYEALSFGGFWAWDPVENSSLVPWLVLVAAGHTMIINKNNGGSLFTTHFLAIGSFLLVLYSTFLTRSGVLGNASVHAFTDLGMTGQLVIYVLTFILISVALLLEDDLHRASYVVVSVLLLFMAGIFGHKRVILFFWLAASTIITIVCNYRFFPKQKEEEKLFSREFWIFLGSLVLLMASLIITYFTSIPVLNKLFGVEYAPPKPGVYNTWMIPFAILLSLLMAGALFLKYKKTEAKKFLRRMMYAFLLALLFGASCSIPLYFIGDGGFSGEKLGYAGLLIAAFFAIFSNIDYVLTVMKGKISKSGAAIAHLGFALILLGALVSTSKKAVISRDTSGKKISSLGEEFDAKESILLTQGDTLPMGPYLVTYTKKSREGINVYFNVDYLKINKDNKPEYEFTLVPRIQDNPIMGQAAEPDTRHYLNRDIYTHITHADLNVDTSHIKDKAFGDAKNYIGHVGDTLYSSNALIVIDSLRTNIGQKEYEKNDSLLIVTAVLRAIDAQSKTYKAYPKYIIKNSVVIPEEDIIEELGLKFVFWKIDPEEGHVEITMSEKASNAKDFIVMKAFIFPYINVLWLGCIIMALGTFIAIMERIRKFKLQSK